MAIRTDDLRILDIKEPVTPEEVAREYACSDRASATVSDTRRELQRILHRQETIGSISAVREAT